MTQINDYCSNNAINHNSDDELNYFTPNYRSEENLDHDYNYNDNTSIQIDNFDNTNILDDNESLQDNNYNNSTIQVDNDNRNENNYNNQAEYDDDQNTGNNNHENSIICPYADKCDDSLNGLQTSTQNNNSFKNKNYRNRGGKNNKKNNWNKQNNNQNNYKSNSGSSNNNSQKNNKNSYNQNNQSPKNNDQSTNQNNQSPKNNNQSPNQNNQSPKHNNQSPNQNNHSPKHNNQSPKHNNQSPKNNNHSPNQNNQKNECEIKTYNNTNNNSNNKDKEKKKDLVNELWDNFRPFINKRKLFQPLESFILKLHYRLASNIFFIAFIIVWKAWFIKDPITCINAYGADQPPVHLLNICLSYSFIEIFGENNEVKRKYLLSYRWIPFLFLILCVFFYFPRVFLKRFGNIKFRALVTDLHRVSRRYDFKNKKELMEDIVKYYDINLGTHYNNYSLFLMNHFICLVISSATFFFINFILQGSFLYLPSMFPFLRDPKLFDDGLSRIFPPFVNCSISPAMKMVNTRTETFNCHLTLMELYEKLFTLVWFMLCTLIIANCLYVIFLAFISFRPFRKIFLLTKRKTKRGDKTNHVLLKHLDLGDLFSLYVVKSLISEVMFSLVCERIAEIIEKRIKAKILSLEWKEVFDDEIIDKVVHYSPKDNAESTLISTQKAKEEPLVSSPMSQTLVSVRTKKSLFSSPLKEITDGATSTEIPLDQKCRQRFIELHKMYDYV